MRRPLAVLATLVGFGLAGCGDGVFAPADTTGAVAVRFAPPTSAEGSSGPGEPDRIVLSGSNGTLVLTDVRMVLADFELKRDDQIADCAFVGRSDLCAELDLGPVFLALPLTRGEVIAGEEVAPTGEYEELEFQVRSLDPDLDREREVLAAIRAEPGFADWPARASIAATGEFRDAFSGEVRPFRTYFSADVEVEAEFGTPLPVGSSGAASVITLRVDPARWLRFQDGVVDLSAFDYGRTGLVPEFEVPIGSGLEVEVRG